MNEVSAVECRTEIDLKIGAAFTRLQTLVLQKRLDRSLLREGPVSYGKLPKQYLADADFYIKAAARLPR